MDRRRWQGWGNACIYSPHTAQTPRPLVPVPRDPHLSPLSKLLIRETPATAQLYSSHISHCPHPQVNSWLCSEAFTSTSWKLEAHQAPQQNDNTERMQLGERTPKKGRDTGQDSNARIGRDSVTVVVVQDRTLGGGGFATPES